MTTDPTNPFAAPQADLTAPGAAWLHAGSPSLRSTRIGLTLVYYGVTLALICVLFGAVVGMNLASETFRSVAVALAVGVIVGSLLMFLGPLVCLAVPPQTGARGYAVGAVCFQLANFAWAVAQPLLASEIPRTAAVAVSLLGLVGNVPFVLFLRRLAEYVGRRDLLALTRNLIVVAVIAMICTVVLVGHGVAGSLQPAPWKIPRGLLVLAGLNLAASGIAALVMYIKLIEGLRTVLRRR